MMFLGSVNMTCAGKLLQSNAPQNHGADMLAYLCFLGIHLTHRHVSCSFRQGLVFRLGKLSNYATAKFLLQIEGNGGEFVELVPESLDYLGPQDLTQYFIR